MCLARVGYIYILNRYGLYGIDFEGVMYFDGVGTRRKRHEARCGVPKLLVFRAHNLYHDMIK